MGRRISKEFLHPSILEGVNDKIGNLDSLETDAKGNMVQAINELVEKLDNSAEIENGKELIANAVGEPLTAEDSFDEMSTDINSLLSTFKTNMMNNGITVESGDRFKSLIDKIATMVGEGSGKGIQFEMGTDTINIIDSGSAKTKTVSGLKFIPTYVFCFVQGKVWHEDDELDVGYTISDLVFGSVGETYWDSGAGYFKVTINDNNSFTIKTYLHGSTYEAVGETPFTWYAIGVGEEDTTLRDSLADILENKGVDVTEEDDMASLITKVDSISGGLDIISATELPNKVVNNQVCLITESFGKVYIANELSTSVLNEGDVYIKTTTTGYYATTHIITPMSNIDLNLSKVIQIKNGAEEKIDGYVGINGQWVPTDSLEFYLFKQGTGLHSSVGGFDIIESDGTYSVNNNRISLTGYKEFGHITIQSKNKIDLTEYSKLEVKSSSSSYGSFTLSVGGNVLYLSENASEPAVLNISTINGLYNIEITKGANYQEQSGTIYYIKLIKEFG